MDLLRIYVYTSLYVENLTHRQPGMIFEMSGQNKQIKIINILHDSRIGGPQVRVVTVGALLRGEGISTTVVFPKPSSEFSNFLSDFGLGARPASFTKVPNPKKAGELLRWILALPIDTFRFYKINREQGPDLVHVNSIYLLHAALAAALARIPLIWHLNDTGLPPSIAKIAGRIAYRIASRVVAAASAVGYYHGLKDGEFDLFYAPVDTSIFIPQPKSAIDAEHPRIGIIANWNWMKGYDDLVEVIFRLKNDFGIKASAICFGRILDNQRDYHETIMEKARSVGISEQIEVLGFVEKPAELVASLDVLLLPSRSEACPISVLEAISCGVPVVAFDVGGVKEQLLRSGIECGIVVNKRDVDAMASAVRDLVQDPETYDRMSANGRTTAQTVFDTSAIARAHSQLYRKLTKGFDR